MDEAAARVTAMFEDLAPDYDRSGVDFFVPIAAGLLQRVPPAADQRWLDVGCGPGAVLLPAAAGVGPGGRAVGIDVAAAMVDRARAAAGELGLPQVEAHVADATEPPPGPFDTVVSSLVLFFLSDPVAALSAWRQVLVPGGRLGVTTFGRTDDRLLHIEDVLQPWVPAAMRDPRTVGDESPFVTDEGVEGLVAAAGYVDVRTDTFALPVRFSDADRWYAFSWSIVQRGMWRAVPEDRREEVRAEAARRFAAYADDDGSATFTIDVRCTLATSPG